MSIHKKRRKQFQMEHVVCYRNFIVSPNVNDALVYGSCRRINDPHGILKMGKVHRTRNLQDCLDEYDATKRQKKIMLHKHSQRKQFMSILRIHNREYCFAHFTERSFVNDAEDFRCLVCVQKDDKTSGVWDISVKEVAIADQSSMMVGRHTRGSVRVVAFVMTNSEINAGCCNVKDESS